MEEVFSNNEAEPIDGKTDDVCALVGQWKAEVPTVAHTAALFLLTMQEKYCLSQKAINFAVHSVGTLIDKTCDSVRSSVKRCLCHDSVIDDFCFDHEDPFASLQTDYQQTKFYREQFGLVVSMNRIHI